MKDTKNELAFPCVCEELVNKEFGLTKREYFAAKAMQGFCATGNYATLGDIAEDAVKAADALLEELEK